MKYLLLILFFSCTDPLTQPRYEPVDSSAVDPQPRPDTLHFDSTIQYSTTNERVKSGGRLWVNETGDIINMHGPFALMIGGETEGHILPHGSHSRLHPGEHAFTHVEWINGFGDTLSVNWDGHGLELFDGVDTPIVITLDDLYKSSIMDDSFKSSRRKRIQDSIAKAEWYKIIQLNLKKIKFQ